MRATTMMSRSSISNDILKSMFRPMWSELEQTEVYGLWVRHGTGDMLYVGEGDPIRPDWGASMRKRTSGSAPLA